jgi:hypothetical protein
LDNILDVIAGKLKSAGMDDASIAASRKALSKEFSRLSAEELEIKLASEGGADGITESILKKYESVKKKAADSEPDNIGLDDDMFSDEPENINKGADNGDAAAEPKDEENDIESIISEIDGKEDSPSQDADEYFNDDADVKVKKPEKKKNPQKQGEVPAKAGGKNVQKKKKISVKNMSPRAKTAYIIGLVLLIPLLIILVVAITLLFLALYAAVVALVIAFSVALVVIAAVGTALSLMAIIFGIIQLVQGAAVPIGLYEIGLGIAAGGITLGVSILLYNFIVRLAPFLFKKMFVLYKFLFRQLTKLLGFVKGACSKL